MIKRLFYIILTLLFISSCGGSSTQTNFTDEEGLNGVVLPEVLFQVDPNLAGTIFVYDSNGNRELSDDMIFELSGGNTVAVTPPLTLAAGASFRFIVIFTLSGTNAAYIDETFTLSTSATTNLTWVTGDIITSTDSIDEILASDIIAGTIPNLDLDNDGFSNLSEINAGTDPEDENEYPQD